MGCRDDRHRDGACNKADIVSRRRRAREYALQILFQLEYSGEKPDITGFFKGQNEDPQVEEFTARLVNGAVEHLAELDETITSVAEHWDVSRMAAVDRNLLRLGTYELCYQFDVPPAVSINEYLEVAKKFSSSEAPKFINGILDKVARQKRPEGVRKQPPKKRP